jgi:hypothetical protein
MTTGRRNATARIASFLFAVLTTGLPAWAQSSPILTIADPFDNTPEGAYRSFVVAIRTGNEKALRDLTVPTEDFPWLLLNRHIAPEGVAQFRHQISQLPVKRLKPGDTATLADGRKLVIQAEEVTAERAVVFDEGGVMPTRIQLIKGRWRVNASLFIASKKAHDRALKDAEVQRQSAKAKKAARPKTP